jgi:hypothetical protein
MMALPICVLSEANQAVGAPAVPLVPSLDVVGGPDQAGNREVVVYVDPAHQLHLAGIDPVSFKVVWQYPYSAMGADPATSVEPLVIGHEVLDVRNTGKPKDGLVQVAGINANTGEEDWNDSGSFSPTDSPTPCAQEMYFCIPGYDSDTTTSLLLLQPAGQGDAKVLPGPYSAIGPDLYETDAKALTLEQLTPSGSKAWVQTEAALFGPGFSSDYGWDFTSTPTLEVGSIEPIVKGNGYNVSKEKMLGINQANGAVEWSLPDEYTCGGALWYLTSQVACSYGGVTSKAAVKNKPPSYKGLTVSLVGFNPDTGTVTWTVPILDVDALLNGDGLPYLDDTHVVVTLSGDHKVLLDTSNGSMAPIPRGQIFWCQKEPDYKVQMPKQYSSFADRTSTPIDFGCTANGRATATFPQTSPDSVGSTVDGVFVWPSLGGRLHARVLHWSHTHV